MTESSPPPDESLARSRRPRRRKSVSLPNLPILPVRDAVLFPHMVTPLFVARDRSMRAVEAAIEENSSLVVLAQRDPELQDPGPNELYEIGTQVTIGRVLKMPDGTTSIVAHGRGRVKLLDYTQTEPYLRGRFMPLFEIAEEGTEVEALRRATLSMFEQCVELNSNMPEDAYVAAMNVTDPGRLADLVASVLTLEVDRRQELLETMNPRLRLEKLSVLLARELDVLQLQNKIHSAVQDEVDKSQREYYLREQMRVIQNELGEGDTQIREIADLRDKIAASGMPGEVREKAEKEVSRLIEMPPASPEMGIIRTYLDWLIELPWTTNTADNMDLRNAERILDANHYGLPKAKERILEYIAVRKLAAAKMRSPILCFVGPPGTGKTSLGRSIAEALGRKFVRVSLGGIRDEAEIRGHRRTYIGALPGRIIQTMRRAGTVNPLFMLDEIDKIGLDFRGDPAAALLEVLDPEQNSNFSDHYLDVPYDLSKVLFIATCNVLDTVPPALRDRMEVIRFPGYIEEEKLSIARQFLIPRQLEEHGLPQKSLKFSDEAVRHMIREYTYEAGVRNLEREIANVCRKIARRVAEDRIAPKTIGTQQLLKYLGPPEFTYGLAQERDEIGVATGIAVTDAGGDLLSIEVNLMEGKGTLTLTGSLGDVMQESAQAALSYARAHARELGINPQDFERLDIHVHVPEGAMPKDGPSAGITIATALISALLQRPVHREVAMTGEITLRGRVLPIGGFKEKVIAAHRAGLKTVLVPQKNKKDAAELPARVRRDLNLVFVDRMDEVLPIALMEATPNGAAARAKPRRAPKPAAPSPLDVPVGV
ncbi:MAG: endopeptidase La [Anaerolineae bacterium]